MNLKTLLLILVCFYTISCNSILKEYIPEPESSLEQEDPNLYYLETEVSVYKNASVEYYSNSKSFRRDFQFKEGEIWELFIIPDTLSKGDRLYVQMFNASYNNEMRVSIVARQGRSKQRTLIAQGSTTNYYLNIGSNLTWLPDFRKLNNDQN